MTATDMANRITELEQMVEGLRHELAEARSGGAIIRAKEEGAKEMRDEMLAMLREQIRALEVVSRDDATLALMGAAIDSELVQLGDRMVSGTLNVLGVVLKRMERASIDVPF